MKGIKNMNDLKQELEYYKDKLYQARNYIEELREENNNLKRKLDKQEDRIRDLESYEKSAKRAYDRYVLDGGR